MGIRIYRAVGPPTGADVRELKAFLGSPLAEDEKSLQHLLERHPRLVGILGFSDFISEAPIYKPDLDNEPDLADLRRRDRADIIAARTSPILTSYRSADIIELKAAACNISERRVGFRLSTEASKAIEQLLEYRSWLETIPQNREFLNNLQWEVRHPRLHLIMGRWNEFSSNPGQLEEIRSRLLDKGVELYTVDDVLERAAKHVDERIVPPSVVEWSSAPSGVASGANLHIAGAVIPRLQEALEIAANKPWFLEHMPPRAFEELVAEVYRRRGYTITFNHRTLDKGIDFVARTGIAHSEQITVAIQCQQIPRHRDVRLVDVRALLGAMIASRVNRGIVVTTGRSSLSGEEDLARQVSQLSPAVSQLSLVDLAQLTAMILQGLDPVRATSDLPEVTLLPEALEQYVSGTIPDIIDNEPGIEQRLMRAERTTVIRNQISALPERQRMALLMHRYEEMNYRQIGEVLHISESAAKALLFRAYGTLRQGLKGLI